MLKLFPVFVYANLNDKENDGRHKHKGHSVTIEHTDYVHIIRDLNAKSLYWVSSEGRSVSVQ